MVQIICWGRGNLDLMQIEGQEKKDKESSIFPTSSKGKLFMVGKVCLVLIDSAPIFDYLGN